MQLRLLSILACAACATAPTFAQPMGIPARGAPEPSWLGGDLKTLQALAAAISDVDGFKSVNPYRYNPQARSGTPTLLIEHRVEFDRHRGESRAMAQGLSLAFSACFLLDVEAMQPGAWGPRCEITKFIKLPAGKLAKATWTGAGHGDYMYTPPRVGTDRAKYVLQNGAGARVVVTFIIKAVPETHEQ